MTIECKEGVLHCAGTLAVDDAEQLLQALQMWPGEDGLDADFSSCEHVHSACLQVLMAARVRAVAWPAQAVLAAWLRAALEQHNPYN